MKIRVKVKPNSKNQEVVKKKNKYIVRVKSRAKEGKANAELEKLLKKYFNSDVRITSGLRGRKKVVEVMEK